MIKKIDQFAGRRVYSVETQGDPFPERVIFKTDAGNFCMYHKQECCEQVALVDSDGWNAFDDAIIYDAEVVTNDRFDEEARVYLKWTFYKFRTSKGYCTMRWLGHTHGYYGVEVSIEPC